MSVDVGQTVSSVLLTAHAVEKLCQLLSYSYSCGSVCVGCKYDYFTIFIPKFSLNKVT
jgi:hypothetical protein